MLIIDNCPSSNATRDLVARFPRVRYVREDRPGLNIARNRAFREGRGDVIAFTDDDAAPDRGWLRALVRNLDDDLVIAATGLTMPIELETEAQECFERMGGLGRGFKRMVLDATKNDPLKGWHAGAGVNIENDMLGKYVARLIEPMLSRPG